MNLLHYGPDDLLYDEDEQLVICSWFAMCENPATALRAHPVLGGVPICDRCFALTE